MNFNFQFLITNKLLPKHNRLHRFDAGNDEGWNN